MNRPAPSLRSATETFRSMVVQMEEAETDTLIIDVVFPDDSELARVLPVHYPLTYEKLASYGFDPNAEYLYALELISEQGE